MLTLDDLIKKTALITIKHPDVAEIAVPLEILPYMDPVVIDAADVYREAMKDDSRDLVSVTEATAVFASAMVVGWPVETNPMLGGSPYDEEVLRQYLMQPACKFLSTAIIEGSMKGANFIQHPLQKPAT